MASSHFSTVALVALSLAAGIAPAVAGDAAKSAASWSGPFVGAAVGLGQAHITYTDGPDPVFNTPATTYQFADRRTIYSLHAGYDQQIGSNVVVGAEISGDLIPFDIAPFGSGGFGSIFSSKYDFAASARGGILLDRNTLGYLRVGIGGMTTMAETGTSGFSNQLLPAGLVGFGIDTRLVGGLTARLEADYMSPLAKMSLPADFKSFDPKFLKITTGLYWKLDTAADVPTPDAAYEPSRPAFSGAYAGMIGGLNVSQMDTPINTAGATVGPWASQNASVGVVAGYNLRMDHVVAGIEANVQQEKSQFFDPGQDSLQQGSTKLFGSIDGVAMLDAKLGVMVTPTTMIYVKAGGGVIQTTANPEFFTFGSGHTALLMGHQIGGGIETMLSENVGVHLDGMYTQADEGLTVDLAALDQATLYPSFFSATAGINWHF